PAVRVRPKPKVRRAPPPPLLSPSVSGTAKKSNEVPLPAAESSAGVETPAPGGPGAGSGAGIGSDSSGARAIYAPQPVIPDSLREEALQTVAVARFKVTYDSRVQVTLITPTESPQLNELLLETLKMWRFFPAMKSGV